MEATVTMPSKFVHIDESMNKVINNTSPFHSKKTIVQTTLEVTLENWCNQANNVEDKMQRKLVKSKIINCFNTFSSEINLCNHKLTSFPPGLDLLSNLRVIRLQNNFISYIPHNAFPKNSQLQYIDLSGNQISNIDNTSLKNLPNLKELCLANNKLNKFSLSMLEGTNKIEHLDLSYNSLERFNNDGLSNLSSLLSLDISNNLLSKHLGEFRSYSLYTLDLSNNLIGRYDIDCNTFNKLNKLKYLSLSGNPIIVIKQEYFNNLKHLISIDLRNTKLKRIYQKSFSTLKILTYLYLDNNHLKFISKRTIYGLDSLRVLSIWSNKKLVLSEPTKVYLQKIQCKIFEEYSGYDYIIE